MGTPRTLTYVPLERVRPAELNPRTHDIPRITSLIREYGFTVALLVDERTGRLVAGHGRLAALVGMMERAESPPDGILVGDDLDWLVPVQRGWSSKSDTHANAMLVADNNASQNAEWINYGLAELIEGVATNEPELIDSTGVDIDELLRTVSVERLTEPDPDQVTMLPDAADPNSGEQTIDTPPAIGQTEDRPLGDDDEGTSFDEPKTTCPACKHTWVRDQDKLTVLGSPDPVSVGDILRHGSGVLLSGGAS